MSLEQHLSVSQSIEVAAEQGEQTLPEALYIKDGENFHPVYPVGIVAAEVGLSYERVYQLALRGDLRAVKFGMVYGVSLEDAQRYVAGPKRKPGPVPGTRRRSGERGDEPTMFVDPFETP